jgi:membrane peptidoglycan carboxypeptidase
MGAAARMGLVLYAVLALLGAIAAVVMVGGYVRLSANLPDPTLLEQIQLPEQSIVYDRTGKQELARFGQFNREVVTFDQIPPVLVDATTAVEDRTFWDNAGFDPVGILASGLDALRGNARGGSTITQQLVRQRLLTADQTAQTDRTFTRKIKEIIQSIRVTQAYAGVAGKQRIMTAYLNQNYYGNDSYGVAAAAQSYFGKSLKDLTLAQAAIIAAIPQAPSAYDLVQNAVQVCQDPGPDANPCKTSVLQVPDTAPIVLRRNLVLSFMAQGRTPLTGATFTAADFAAAQNEPVILAAQASPQWVASQFVWQVRRELATALCGQGVATCPIVERGGLTITTTLDLRLQGIAEKWVKAAAVVPQAKNPAAAAKAIGMAYQPWMQNLHTKDLHNGALIAEDYQTGEILAYVGSADANATVATKKFQPRFDVLADGWRQPGSAFKPIMYATGISAKYITAASMFMDVVTDFGGGYVPSDADQLERGPVRVRDALRFSLNIPAVKTMSIVGVSRVQAQAEAMGVNFQNGPTNAGLSFALGVSEVHSIDLVRAYGVLGDGGKLADQTTLVSVTDPTGAVLLGPSTRAQPAQVLDAGTAYIMTDILAGNTDPAQNPFWGKFELTSGGKHRPATLKTGTNNDAKDLNAYGYLGTPSAADRAKGEYALAVGAWAGNSDNSLVSTAGAPLLSLDVTTYMWQGFLSEATKGWSINGFARPDGLDQAKVDAWTGLAASAPASGAAAGPAVNELFLAGTAPGAGLPTGTCGADVFSAAGFEKANPAWLAADTAWLKRAQRGSGVAGGPKNTKTTYFYNGLFSPYGHSWGPVVGGAGCGSPSPSPSVDPCASQPVPASVDPSAPAASPGVACPTPSGASASPSVAPSESPSAAPTPTPPPATPTPPPATVPPPTPVPTPTPVPSVPSVAPSAVRPATRGVA